MAESPVPVALARSRASGGERDGERPQPRGEPRDCFRESFPVFGNEESPILPLVPCVFKTLDGASSLTYQHVVTRSVFMLGIGHSQEGRAPAAPGAPEDTRAHCPSPWVWLKLAACSAASPTEAPGRKLGPRAKNSLLAFGEEVPGGWLWGAW